jgi:hypothetical protein
VGATKRVGIATLAVAIAVGLPLAAPGTSARAASPLIGYWTGFGTQINPDEGYDVNLHISDLTQDKVDGTIHYSNGDPYPLDCTVSLTLTGGGGDRGFTARETVVYNPVGHCVEPADTVTLTGPNTLTLSYRAGAITGSANLTRQIPPSGFPVDCFDGNFPTPPVDTRPAASYCVSNAGRVGLNATLDRDKTATDAATALQNDNVFYFVGHSQGGCTPSTNQVGVALLFPAGSKLEDFTHTGDDCLDSVVKWPTPLDNVRLAVLQACSTMATAQGIGRELRGNGVKTVVGFTQEVGFSDHWGDSPGGYTRQGDAWAHAFWSALGDGQFITTALDYGQQDEYRNVLVHWPGNPYDGYDSYVLDPFDRHSDTLAELAHGQFSALRTPDTRRASAALRNLATIRRYIRRPLPADTVWTAQPGPSGREILVSSPRVGLFVLDARTHAVDLVVLARAMGAARPVSRRQAERRAAAYAARHGVRVSRLVLARVTLVNPGKFRAYSFYWQARRHGVWLPTDASVIVRVRDGRVTSFAKRVTPLRTRLTPKVSKARAITIGTEFANGSLKGKPVLEVIKPKGRPQELVWVMSVRRETGSFVLVAPTVVWVDARTGRAYS